MPLFHFHKDERGNTRMVPVGDAQFMPKPRPVKPGVDLATAGSTAYKCKACEKERCFTTPAIFARHFSASHRDIYVDKDTWRDYFEIVVSPQTGD